MKMMADKKEIIIITGSRGAGKTAYCRNEIQKARENSLIVRGVLSPAMFLNHKKIAFYAQNLKNDEKRLVGSLASYANLGKQFHDWTLDPDVIRWVNEFLSEKEPCDLLVIDELGPLEFSDHEGYLAAFDCLKNQNYRKALVVIRPECIDAFRSFGFSFSIVEIEKADVAS